LPTPRVLVTVLALLFITACGATRKAAPTPPLTPAPKRDATLVLRTSPGLAVRLSYHPHGQNAPTIVLRRARSGANGAVAFPHALVVNRGTRVGYLLEVGSERVWFSLAEGRNPSALMLTLSGRSRLLEMEMLPKGDGQRGRRLRPFEASAVATTYRVRPGTFYRVRAPIPLLLQIR
jgi:hypothetical protein